MTAFESAPTARERRIARRHPVSAEAIIRQGEQSASCRVQDVSLSGAGLLLAADTTAPDAFDLVTRSGAIYPVEVAWRSYPRCGVTFTVPAGLPGEGGDIRRAVVEPWVRPGLRRWAPLLIALCLVLAAALVWYALSGSPSR